MNHFQFGSTITLYVYTSKLPLVIQNNNRTTLQGGGWRFEITENRFVTKERLYGKQIQFELTGATCLVDFNKMFEHLEKFFREKNRLYSKEMIQTMKDTDSYSKWKEFKYLTRLRYKKFITLKIYGPLFASKFQKRYMKLILNQII